MKAHDKVLERAHDKCFTEYVLRTASDLPTWVEPKDVISIAFNKPVGGVVTGVTVNVDSTSMDPTRTGPGEEEDEE